VIFIKPKRADEIRKMLCGCEDCQDIDLYFTKLQKLGEMYENDDVYNNLSLFSLALASPERLIILNVLKEKDRCVCELETILNKSQSTISHHLRKLVTAGLIKGWKKDKFTYYTLLEEKLKNYIEILNKEFDYKLA